MESLLAKLTGENAFLKQEIRLKDWTARLHHSLNAVEQYSTSWSLCVNNIVIPAEEETNPKKVLDDVYSNLVLPIFSSALPVQPGCPDTPR
jgi:hypothetical protein